METAEQTQAEKRMAEAYQDLFKVGKWMDREGLKWDNDSITLKRRFCLTDKHDADLCCGVCEESLNVELCRGDVKTNVKLFLHGHAQCKVIV